MWLFPIGNKGHTITLHQGNTLPVGFQMNAWRFIFKIALIGCLGVSASSTIAQDDKSIFGTHEVVFQPGQSGGKLHSSSLVYRAVVADFAYRNGRPNVIVGNIAVSLYNSKLALTLKIGVKELEGANTPFERPHFAYLQTKNHTTAKIPFGTMDGDNGFRLIIWNLEGPAIDLVMEMAKTGTVTIGFNRNEDGLDVLVPIDLTVINSDYTPAGEVIRQRSVESVNEFLKHIRPLIDEYKNILKK